MKNGVYLFLNVFDLSVQRDKPFGTVLYFNL